MSEEASLATPIATSPMALEPVTPIASSPLAPEPTAFPIQDSVLELKLLLSAFIAVSKEDKQRYKDDIEELRSAVTLLDNRETPEKSADSSIIDRTGVNRRSSMFFGSPNARNYRTDSKTQIQILQNDVVYEKELKISSLEGLQYLSKQMQILGSKYPGRDIKMSHMVSYSLRPHVIQAYNSYCYKESIITGIEPNEVLAEDWLSLDNTIVQDILIEAARPRTREMYSKELILFLGKGIPQTPPICTDNFSKLFYAPLVKSLNDLLSLYDLMSAETSNHSNNKAKMPTPGYGTTNNPGHVSLWIISLGSQKNSVLQWLGKDELCKHKTILSAVKYVKSKLLEAQTQSDGRQDLDSKLTPIKYEDVRHTQGESYSRQQIHTPLGASYQTPDNNRSYQNRHKSTLNVMYSPTDGTGVHDGDIDTHDTLYSSDDTDPNIIGCTFPPADVHVISTTDDAVSNNESFFAAVEETGPRASVALTFRGYCSETFVTGKCSRRDTCSYDHSAAGQERCIQSFTLLAKRELGEHNKLPPYSVLKPRPSSNTWSKSTDFSSKPTAKHTSAGYLPALRQSGYNSQQRDNSK